MPTTTRSRLGDAPSSRSLSGSSDSASRLVSSVHGGLKDAFVRGLKDIFQSFVTQPDFRRHYERDIALRLYRPWHRVGNSMRLALGKPIRLTVTLSRWTTHNSRSRSGIRRRRISDRDPSRAGIRRGFGRTHVGRPCRRLPDPKAIGRTCRPCQAKVTNRLQVAATRDPLFPELLARTPTLENRPTQPGKRRSCVRAPRPSSTGKLHFHLPPCLSSTTRLCPDSQAISSSGHKSKPIM